MIDRVRGVFGTTLNCLKIPELKSRIIFTVAVLFVVRLISLIPVPGLDGALLTEFLKESAAKNDNSLLGMYSLFTGGALERCGIGSLGIMPYISATIIMEKGSACGIPVSLPQGSRMHPTMLFLIMSSLTNFMYARLMPSGIPATSSM